MKSRRIRTLSMVGLVVCAALASSPTVADAASSVTVTAYGEGESGTAALSNAEVNARIKLNSQAAQAGQTCSNISTSSQLIFSTPFNHYVAQGWATGLCG